MDSSFVPVFKKSRLRAILDHGDFSDCTFVIAGEEIRAHKLLLACSSPVFERMFYGELSTDRVDIVDVAPDVFRQMLDFVYTESVQFTSAQNAWALFYLANKYLLSDFSEVCTTHIEKNLTMSNLAVNYEYASMYELEELKSKCLQDMAQYFRGLLDDTDYHMQPATILAVLKQPSLGLELSDLMKGLIDWASVECEMKGLTISPETILQVFTQTGLLPHLTDLRINVDKSEVNTLENNVLQMIVKLKNPATPYWDYFKKHWSCTCKCRQIYKISGKNKLSGLDYMRSNVNVNKSTLLFGLVVVTETGPSLEHSEHYAGSIVVKIVEIGNPNSVIVTVFSGTFPYDNAVYVPLKKLFRMDPDRQYSIRIGFRNSNSLRLNESSVICNYMSCKLVIEKKKTIFTFEEREGSVVRGICSYPI